MKKTIRVLLLIFLGFFFLCPLLALFFQFQFSYQEIQDKILQPSFLKSFVTTIKTCSFGGFFAVFLGLIFARQFALNKWRLKRVQKLILLIPYLVPNFVLAIAFVIAWNPTSGVLNFIFQFPFGLYGISGISFLFAIAHLPIAFLMLENKIQRIDPSLIEAARLSGASHRQIFYKIELPLLIPTLISSFCLCFALNISAFAIPAWIGAPEKNYTLTYKVYQAIQLGRQEGIHEASFYSLILFGLALIPFLAQIGLQKNEKRFVTVCGKASRVVEKKQSLKSFIGFQLFFWATQILFWIAPLFCLLASTLVKPGCIHQEGLGCFSKMSLHAYSYVLFDLAETKSALQGSFIYGSLSALLILLISFFSLFLFSKNQKMLKIIEWVFSIPIATPGAIIAIGLIIFYSGGKLFNFYNTPWIVVIAYILKHQNLAFQPLKTGLMNISTTLMEAAQVSGAYPLKVWTAIVLPILKPEVLGGFFLVLIPILGELTMSIFLASPVFQSIGTVLFDLQDYADQTSAAALSILLVIFILCLNQLAWSVSKGKVGY